MLKFIHGNVAVKFGNEKSSMSTGVPQGLTTSPTLFNISTLPLIDSLD
jgi:hypothetical protein